MTHFDLIIIGTGSGNSLVTPDFADKRVAIVEKGVFGGTCLNVGCIPTKMFVQAAEIARATERGGKLGVDSSVDEVRWVDIRDRVFSRIDAIAEGGRTYRESGSGDGNTHVFSGHGRFIDNHTVKVEGYEEPITGDQIVIATGARPTIPDVIADAGISYDTSDTIMRIDALPKTMTILGAGFIALEFANIFSALGVDVRMIMRGERVLRQLDEDITAIATEEAAKKWTLLSNKTIQSASETAEGITLELSDGTAVTSERLLVATGRTPNTDDLGLETTDVKVRDNGLVEVDEYGRTAVEGVWALGDACSPFQLKHVANAEERAVAHNLVHPDDLQRFPHENVPFGVFGDPQMAAVGLSEKDARAAGHDVTVKIQRYGDTAYGWALEDSTSVCKVVADKKTKLLLGVHFIGPEASTLIQPAIQAMSFGLTVPEMARGQYWIHPALTEVLENALLGLEFDAS